MRTVPCPFTSMAPPSSTTWRSRWTAGTTGTSRSFAARAGFFASFFQSGYFAQALNRNPATTFLPFLRTKIGPLSRVQIRSVRARCSSTFSRGTVARWRIFRTFFSCFASSTRRRTFSPRATFRTISAKTHGTGPKRPGQSRTLWGQASQVASCRPHSAGMTCVRRASSGIGCVTWRGGGVLIRR